MFPTISIDYLTNFLKHARNLPEGGKLEALKRETLAEIQKATLRDQTLINETEVVKIFRAFSRKTLQTMRYQGRGPRYVKFGTNRNSRVFYKICDIRDFINQHYENELSRFSKCN